MSTQAEAYVRAQNGAVALALRDLHRLWSSLDLANGEAVRDALGLVWVDLIGTYGDVTATLAADRFEELTGKPATMVRPVDPDRANARMRWALGPLSGDDGDALARLGLLTDELVKQPGRSTTIASARSHNLRVARVPSGSETCNWCVRLGSRGFTYASRASALAANHGNCDCRIAVEGEDTGTYNPDALYERYLETRSM